MEKEFVVKVHKAYRWVVAVCDKELVGQKIEEDKKQLDLTGPFFQGEEKNSKELREIIIDCVREDATFNIIGEKSCVISKELGIIKEEGILEISGVPYALVLL